MGPWALRRDHRVVDASRAVVPGGIFTNLVKFTNHHLTKVWLLGRISQIGNPFDTLKSIAARQTGGRGEAKRGGANSV